MSWAALLLSLCVFLVLAAPVLAGVLLLRRSRALRVAEACCGGCRYPVSATSGTTPRCPECGALFSEVGVLAPRTRGRVVPVVAWLLIVLPLLLCGLMLGSSALLARRAAAERMAALQARTAALERSEAAEKSRRSAESARDAAGQPAPVPGTSDR